LCRLPPRVASAAIAECEASINADDVRDQIAALREALSPDAAGLASVMP
jgi:hypothetical protein